MKEKEKALITFKRKEAKENPESYEIKSLEDIRNLVPIEKVDEFLEDFAFIILAWHLDLGVKTEFTWIDDKITETEKP